MANKNRKFKLKIFSIIPTNSCIITIFKLIQLNNLPKNNHKTPRILTLIFTSHKL